MVARQPRRLRAAILAIALVALLAPPGQSEADTALESQLVLCNQCHGPDGNSTTKDVPSLAGQPETFLVTQLIYFREGLRSSEKMSPYAAKLDDRTIEALAANFSALPLESTAGTRTLHWSSAASSWQRPDAAASAISRILPGAPRFHV